MSKKRRRRKITEWCEHYGVNATKRYGEYRYGVPKKPITLASVFNAKQRGVAVDKALVLLRDWTLSPFEHEGATRAGIRSSLCLEGHGWLSSDLEAGAIVHEGLRRMGAERPSWEQGQREYTVPAENCGWCAGPRDPSVRGRFCCEECAKAFTVGRQVEATAHDSRILESAKRILRMSAKDRRRCLECSKEFMHEGEADPRQFCSQDCYFKHRRTEAFTKFPSVCKLCDKRFMGRQRGAFYCSNSCQLTESRLRTGRNTPRRLTRPIFDYVVTRPVNDLRRMSSLTPGRLDWLFMEQGLRITAEIKLAA